MEIFLELLNKPWTYYLGMSFFALGFLVFNYVGDDLPRNKKNKKQ